jgi:hypothetical protein
MPLFINSIYTKLWFLLPIRYNGSLNLNGENKMSALATDVIKTTQNISSLPTAANSPDIKTQNEFQAIIKQARSSENILVQFALSLHDSMISNTKAELDYLIKSKIPNALGSQSLEVVKKSVLEKLAQDLVLIQKLNEILKGYKVTGDMRYINDDKNCSFPLKFNKMKEAIEGAQHLIKEHFETIMQQKVPAGYLYDLPPSDITVLGKNDHTIYGNSKGTFFKTALWNIALVCSGVEKLSDLSIGNNNLKSAWVDHSPSVHIVSLPPALNLEELIKIDPGFEHFTYFFRDILTANGLATIHSGYTYGGHRTELTRYPHGKLLGPEDCTSSVARMTGCPHPVTTPDFWFYCNGQINPAFRDNQAYKNWLTGPEPKIIAEHYEMVAPEIVDANPLTVIKPGQTYVHVNFNLETDPKKEGLSKFTGHSGLVVGVEANDGQSLVDIFSFNRDMPGSEGFGLEKFPLDIPTRRVMVFSAKAGAISQAKFIALDPDSFQKIVLGEAPKEGDKSVSSAVSAISTSVKPNPFK